MIFWRGQVSLPFPSYITFTICPVSAGQECPLLALMLTEWAQHSLSSHCSSALKEDLVLILNYWKLRWTSAFYMVWEQISVLREATERDDLSLPWYCKYPKLSSFEFLKAELLLSRWSNRTSGLSYCFSTGSSCASLKWMRNTCKLCFQKVVFHWCN